MNTVLFAVDREENTLVRFLRSLPSSFLIDSSLHPLPEFKVLSLLLMVAEKPVRNVFCQYQPRAQWIGIPNVVNTDGHFAVSQRCQGLDGQGI